MEIKTFYDISSKLSWEEISDKLQNVKPHEVENVLEKKGKKSLDDFLVLLSKTAEDYLGIMTSQSHLLTKKRFGNVIQLYIPLYVSNYCNNVCTYCGYSYTNKIQRLALSEEEIYKEIKAIKDMGHDQVVILTGENAKEAGLSYLSKVLKIARKEFSSVAFEVQPLDLSAYETLTKKGLDAVYCYQETYHEKNYSKYHLKGKKSNFIYRLETADRTGKAGIRKMGLGVLLGLEDFRVENVFLGAHVEYLKKRYWKTKYCISFPRIKKTASSSDPFGTIPDKNFIQLIAAWRLFQEDIELSLSTRENAYFRDSIFDVGITSMSAGSKTSPGSYSSPQEKELAQFEISDERSLKEIQASLYKKGYEGITKDWDKSFYENFSL